MRPFPRSRLPVWQIVTMLMLLSSVAVAGTIGFVLIEGQPLFDSFYMTLITLTTIGYEEIFELTEHGRYFNAVLILAGYTTVFCAIGLMVNALLQLELHAYFDRRRTRNMINGTSNHYIVCGLGRVGRGVIHWLQQSGATIVAIDSDPEQEAWANEHGVPLLIEDATLDVTLAHAGANRATGLVAATSSDAVNVYITLSARVLNPDLRIGARASDEESAKKLVQAGANTVFSPYKFTGYRIAQSLLRPQVSNFLDMASAVERPEFGIDIEEYPITARTSCAGGTVASSGLRNQADAILLAVAKHDATTEFNPSDETPLAPGDTIIMMGHRGTLNRIKQEIES